MIRRAILVILLIAAAVGAAATGLTLGRAGRTAPTFPDHSSTVHATAVPTINHASDATDAPAGEGAAAEQAAPDVGDRPGDTPYSQTVQARAQWEPVVVAFGHAFTSSRGGTDPAAWRTGLIHLVTPALANQLSSTDPAKLPAGTYQGWEAIQYDETTLTVVVTFAEGWSVSVELITDGQRWAITKINPE